MLSTRTRGQLLLLLRRQARLDRPVVVSFSAGSTRRRRSHNNYNNTSQPPPPPPPPRFSFFASNSGFQNNHHHHLNQTIRSYHASTRQEILPLLGAMTVLFVARYSYKALQRMDAEWDDYQWHLKEYEKQHGNAINTTSTFSNSSDAKRSTTLAVDLGTVHMMLAHAAASSPRATPSLVPNPQGGRYTFAGVVKEENDNDNNNNDNSNNKQSPRQYYRVGQEALARFYQVQLEHPEQVLWPYQLLLEQQQKMNNEKKRFLATISPSSVLQALVRPAVRDAMERFGDAAASASGGIRSVVAVPPRTFLATEAIEDYQDAFEGVFVEDNDSSSSSSSPILIPEPVAAIWGAQQLTLLPSSTRLSSDPPILVVDVGGHCTSLSIVQNDRLLLGGGGTAAAVVCVESLGGETFVTQLVEHLLQEQPQYRHDAMAVQRLYLAADAAVAELNAQKRVHVHLPYLGMNLETKQPLHLDAHVSRSVLEQRVQNVILSSVDESPLLLSPHMPRPNDIASLWTSLVTQLLEQCDLTPMQLSRVLLIGGGAKHPMMERSVVESMTMLTGAAPKEKVVVPEVAVRSELVVLGAASLLPNYHYNVDRGLVRNEE